MKTIEVDGLSHRHKPSYLYIHDVCFTSGGTTSSSEFLNAGWNFSDVSDQPGALVLPVSYRGLAALVGFHFFKLLPGIGITYTGKER